ncbi:alpha-glucan family phosphorylase [Deinococcus multiflagellatus]|uniref:Alpha-glucan family phosphorylase n=1 Tax=Deinococcus multiflagellatus TaxID=1656887 RepID=A0ABW1ZIT7_9DEIO|nr:alpha-glucan family phosphorylase [Deinococcus multiflagellatus]MBZ9714353.1 alpha-glucan family phosphorylase [Deinococcus multiflagellatus]
MNVIGKVTVLPQLPAQIARLSELAYNLYWSWTPHAQELYRDLDQAIWERFQRNPVRTLLEVPQARLQAVAADSAYLARYTQVMAEFDAYMGKKDTWASKNAPGMKPVAYFSMEYAFHESLPIYSGGLGVLAGDHCKSASDLGISFTAVGMLFHQGYFRQLFDKDGWQTEAYDELDLTTLPITPAQTPSGEGARVKVRIGDRDVHVRVWNLNVGRIRVLLLDSNVPENSEDDRKLTARLYGGNQELRVQQYVLLGVAGIRALRLLGIPGEVYHMNEGHAALLSLERIREQVAQGLDFRTAVETVAASTLFTTHTPVPAGNDAFGYDLMDRYLGKWPGLLNTSRDDLYALARHDQLWDGHLVPTFSMTVFALNMSRAANGVSELHGEVSRDMWKFLYEGAEAEEVPIGHVTNGAHNLTFTSQAMRDLLSTVLPADWTERLEDEAMWQAVEKLTDEQLRGVQREMKREMIAFVRARVREQKLRNGASAAEVAAAGTLLDENTLTIGFARRFATYKRATLLFRDKERLSRIVNHPERPVQFVFAGKAHPADNPGKAFIQEIYRVSQEPEFRGKIVILENYDMNVARHLVQGVDIWLNNPRRPLEASGTSGMKASFNGSPNLSILDGWWREGYDGTNGWPIGEEREYADLQVQDDADAYSMYQTLEQDITPRYYGAQTGEDAWADTVRRAIQTVSPRFSMQRQVIDYTQKYYLPIAQRGAQLAASSSARAREIASWKGWVRQQWNYTTLTAQAQLPASTHPGQTVPVRAQVNPAGINLNELRVEAVLKRGEHLTRVPLKSHGDGTFSADVPLNDSGLYSVGVRMLPVIDGLSNDLEAGLIKWA